MHSIRSLNIGEKKTISCSQQLAFFDYKKLQMQYFQFHSSLPHKCASLPQTPNILRALQGTLFFFLVKNQTTCVYRSHIIYNFSVLSISIKSKSHQIWNHMEIKEEISSENCIPSGARGSLTALSITIRHLTLNSKELPKRKISWTFQKHSLFLQPGFRH